MGAWATLDVSAARVRDAHRAAPFLDLSGATPAFRPEVDPKASEAKALVSTELLARLGQYVRHYASPEAMLDALAGKPELADSLQTLLAYGMVVAHQQAGSNRRGDRYEADAEVFEGRLKRAAAAVAATAPYVLGLTGRSGGTFGGALASTMNARG